MSMDNQPAIDLLDEWLKRPVMKELTRREWFIFRGRHGGHGKYLWPAANLLINRPLIQHRKLSEVHVSIFWWSWMIRFGYELIVYGAEPVD